MKGITIEGTLSERRLAFDLRDILAVVGEPAIRSTWRITNLECVGDGCERLHEVSELRHVIEGAKLVELAERVGQVIDGDFFAFSDSDSPWLITQAIDSTLFTVFTDREELLDSLQARFTNTAELPPDAAPELRGPGRS